MIKIGRFSQLSELTTFDGDTEKDISRDALSASNLTSRAILGDSGTSDEIERVFDPLSDATLTVKGIRQVLRILVGNFERVQAELPDQRSLVIDLDQMPRSIAVVLVSFVVQVCYFKKITLIYSENSYEIDRKPLQDMLATEDFWHEVYNYPSKLFSIPQAPGRFDASLPKAVFVNGGLDFGRVLNLAARWEPQEISLTYPSQIASERDPALLSAFDSVIRAECGISRLDLAALIENLDQWWEAVSARQVQPMLICGGWKLQAVVACIWACENGRVPAFACMPDFISASVVRIPGSRWQIDLVDSAVLV